MQRWVRWIARRLWWGSLWLMRRRGIRRLQSASMGWMSPAKAERARRGLARQNALARRIGLRLITFLTTLVLISLAIEATYSTAVYLVESGVLKSRRTSDGDAGR